MKKILIPVVCLLLALSACEKDKEITGDRGDIMSTKQIKVYAPAEIQVLLDKSQTQLPFTLVHDVKAVKIAYLTPRPDGKLVNATGAVFIPETSGEFPVICFQHGTQTQRYQVPSLGAGTSDAGIAGAVAASMGYICVAADYLGLGESIIVPPYLIAESSATAVIDMLRASLSYLSSQGIQTDGSLYLAGYSQGGYVTMATHHEMEKKHSDEFQVTASAPLAGPYDLMATFDSVLETGTYAQPIFLAYMMNAYNHYYGWDRLSEIFQQPYAGEMPDYFDGSQMMSTINNSLPRALDSIFLESFLQSYNAGGEETVRNAITSNSLLTYVPSAPVLLVHGDKDEVVPYFNSVKAKEFYNNAGKFNVDILTVPGNHEQAAEAAIVSAMQWFETLRNR